MNETVIKLRNGMCVKSADHCKECPARNDSQYGCTREEILKAGLKIEEEEHGFGYYDINEKDDDEDVETGVPVS